MSQKLANIPLRLMRKFLRAEGCESSKSKGGHEKWVKEGLNRPIILQSHIDPVPEFIVRNALKALGISRSSFENRIKEL